MPTALRELYVSVNNFDKWFDQKFDLAGWYDEDLISVSTEFEEIETFESGTLGATYASGSGLCDAYSGTGTSVYSADAAILGSKGLTIVSSGTTLRTLRFDINGNPSADTFHMRMAGVFPVPSNATRMSLCIIRDSGNATLLDVRISNTGAVQVRDHNLDRGSTSYLVDGVTPIQIAYGWASNLCYLKIYDIAGNLLSSVGGSYATDNPAASVSWGILTAPTTVNYTLKLDEVGYNTARELTPISIVTSTIGMFGVPMN